MARLAARWLVLALALLATAGGVLGQRGRSSRRRGSAEYHIEQAANSTRVAAAAVGRRVRAGPPASDR